MPGTARVLLALLVLLLPSRGGAQPSEPAPERLIPGYEAADPSAAPVTEQDLLERERFWPYRVSLVRPLAAADGGPVLEAGLTGVLLRVEAPALAWIDFGRDGVRAVQVSATDLVARANQIRSGTLDKDAPNLVLAIGPRLVDSAGTSLTGYPIQRMGANRLFVLVFADPRAEGFAKLAEALRSLADPEVLTILLPQAAIPDAEMRERLRELEWTVPFVYDFLSEAYAASLLPGEARLPAVVLDSAEGRVLFRSAAVRAGRERRLREQLDAAIAEALGR